MKRFEGVGGLGEVGVQSPQPAWEGVARPFLHRVLCQESGCWLLVWPTFSRSGTRVGEVGAGLWGPAAVCSPSWEQTGRCEAVTAEMSLEV